MPKEYEGGTVPKTNPEDKRAQGFSEVGIREVEAQTWHTNEGIKDDIGRGTNETGPVSVRK